MHSLGAQNDKPMHPVTYSYAHIEIVYIYIYLFFFQILAPGRGVTSQMSLDLRHKADDGAFYVIIKVAFSERGPIATSYG